MSKNNKTWPKSSSQQFQQITRFDNQQTPNFKYETLKKFIPSPELIVDESLSSSSESNEKYIIKNHHHGNPVSGNSTVQRKIHFLRTDESNVKTKKISILFSLTHTYTHTTHTKHNHSYISYIFPGFGMCLFCYDKKKQIEGFTT